MASTENTPTLVIIGAGAAGTLLGLELSTLLKKVKGLKVILIDNKDFSEFTPSIINVIMQPTPEAIHSRLKEICPKLETMFSGTGVTIIRGKVTEVTQKEVKLDNQDNIIFTHLIICTGSSYSSPFKTSFEVQTIDQRYEELINIRADIDSSSKILCIGGGPVGVEMVGEISSCLSSKEITLFHSKEALVEKIPGNLGPEIKKCLEQSINKNKVEVILNEKAMPEKRDGKEIYISNIPKKVYEPDYVIKGGGIKPNSEIMNNNFSECLDDRGFIIVDNFFKVNGQESIYAIGDVNNIKEPKLYFTAHMQAVTLSKNIESELTGGKPPVQYKGSKNSYVVSVGPSHGLASISEGTIVMKGISVDFLKTRRGSRIAGFMKYAIEKASLSGYVSQPMNQLFYYTMTQ